MLQPLVLVVDDSEELRLLFSSVLTQSGYAVLQAHDGREAIVQATDHRPDLILMDLDMPGVSGWEAVRHLKSDAHTAHIPVVAVTANPGSGLSARLRAARFSAYVAKPVRLPHLVEAVRTIYEASRAGASWVNLSVPAA
ncbi:MAG: response regulator [Gemmatimonadota bacterium]